MSVWHILGIEPTGEERAIKRAYARKLKATRPEDDPAAFQRLRDAYESVLAMLRQEAYFQAQQEEAVTPALADAPIAVDAAALVDAAVVVDTPAAIDTPPAQDAPAPTGTPVVATVDPIRQARQLWTECLALPLQVQPRRRLARAMAREEMLDLRVRDAFELCALQYCAGSACPDELRQAIADHFKWEDDPSYIERRLPHQAWETLARLRAGRSYQQLFAQSSTSSEARMLLATGTSRERHFDLGGRFTRAMQRLIADIRSYHPELLEFKLDREVFETWERRVEGRRYFFSTALASLFAGLVLWSVSAQLLAQFDYPHAALVNFLLIEMLSVGLVAGFVLRRQDPRASQGRFLAVLMNEVRYRPSVQFGWLPLYALASSALYVPDTPAWLTVAIAAALAACLVIASFANSPAFNPMTYLVSVGAGVPLGQALLQDGFQGQALSCMLAAVTGMQLLYRGGGDLFDWSGMAPRRLLDLRLGWMAGAVFIIVFSALLDASATALLPVAWLWLLAGMLLSRPSANPFLILVLAVVGRGILHGALPASSLARTAQMPVMVIAFIAVALFMGVNIHRANKNQHQFA